MREKLDDPKYESWFIKFKSFNKSAAAGSYPGGAGKEENGTYHVPTCDWYDLWLSIVYLYWNLLCDYGFQVWNGSQAA